MEIFLNEWSLQGQFHGNGSFELAGAQFVGLVSAARRAMGQAGGRMWRSGRMGRSLVSAANPLVKAINHLHDREMKEALLEAVYNLPEWEPSRVHLAVDDFRFQAHCVSDTSVAELYERDLLGPFGGGLEVIHLRRFGRSSPACVQRAARCDRGPGQICRAGHRG